MLLGDIGAGDRRSPKLAVKRPGRRYTAADNVISGNDTPYANYQASNYGSPCHARPTMPAQ